MLRKTIVPDLSPRAFLMLFFSQFPSWRMSRSTMLVLLLSDFRSAEQKRNLYGPFHSSYRESYGSQNCSNSSEDFLAIACASIQAQIGIVIVSRSLLSPVIKVTVATI